MSTVKTVWTICPSQSIFVLPFSTFGLLSKILIKAKCNRTATRSLDARLARGYTFTEVFFFFTCARLRVCLGSLTPPPISVSQSKPCYCRDRIASPISGTIPSDTFSLLM